MHLTVKRPPPFLFRPQRALLTEAMAEVREFDGTRAGLQALLQGDYTLADVTAYHGIDERIGWDTYLVTVRSTNNPTPHPFAAGFTNGPVSP